MANPRPQYSQEVHASALKLHLEGHSQHEIARRLGVPQYTLSRWFKRDSPFENSALLAKLPEPGVPVPIYRLSAEGISELVLDTLVETLQAIRARAIETGRPEWISQQKASALADLDDTQWTYAIRVLAAYQPFAAARGEGGEVVQGQSYPAEPEPDRDGAVDAPA